ncbi:hypothetical protein DZB54_16275 [Herbaspirillum sp. 3R-3a1]|nr:hypothetical protein DZB54_16275 [Herbaspirillum sp. 3R-3a1]
MSKHQITREEQRFLVLELDAEKRGSKLGVAALYFLYERVAGYGFSIAKPLFFLIVLPLIFFFALYCGLSAYTNCPSIASCRFDTLTLLGTIEFSVLQSLPPLGIEKASDALRESIFGGEHIGIVIPFIVVQKVMALAGWFFVALALRNLFKMK